MVNWFHVLRGCVVACFVFCQVSFATENSEKNIEKSVVYIGPWERQVTAAEFDEALANYRRIGLSKIVIIITGCQPNKTSSDVGSCTMKSQDTWALVKQARKQGFKVGLLPIIRTPWAEWRGHFNPTDVAKWFETYTKWITDIGNKAETLGVSELVAGTEFNILFKYDLQWREVIKNIRKGFTGRVIVTSNWDAMDLKFWDASDAIGISYYFPLSKSEAPTDTELDLGQAKAKYALMPLIKKWKKKLYVTELGYPSLKTAASLPYYFPEQNDTPILDLELQARCFASFIRVWGDTPELAHLGVWGSFDPKDEYSKFTFEIFHKPVEEVLKQFFTRAKVKHATKTRH